MANGRKCLCAIGLMLVKTNAGEKLHGELPGVTQESLTLNSKERGSPGRIKRSRELRRSDIGEIRALAPTASILAGGAIGGGIGTGLGAIADATAKSHEGRGLITGTLGLRGAGIGAAIGISNPPVKG